MTKPCVAVLISGRGSNLQSLIDAAAQPDYPAQIALVLSNKADAFGLKRAEAAGIATQIISHKDYDGREAFDAAMDEVLRTHQIDLVCLAGFMRLLTPGFVARWEGRMLNIHPSLLPAFKGLDTHRKALDAQVKLHGCSVHFVAAEMDSGPIIIQAAVPVLPEDTPDTLAARVLAQEHIIYPQALAWLASGDVALEAGRVRFSQRITTPPSLVYPSNDETSASYDLKPFKRWSAVKAAFHRRNDPPQFNERDIWWNSIGINIGHETDGKGQQFNRPVLVVRKFNHRLFWGVPLTTKAKHNRHYHSFEFNARKQCAMLSQMRLWDAQRLTHRMGRLSHKEYAMICKKLKDYFE